jgi:hypothetical protein
MGGGIMSVKLTPQIKTYATNIASVGNRMKKTADKFGEVGELPTETKDDIQRKKDNYIRLLEEFKSQKNTLEKQNVPELLQVEHEQLLSSFGKYVNATDMAINSLDVDSAQANTQDHEKAQGLQWEASGEIVKITRKMAEKLGI